jgi:thiamine biosynthesis lipoprotein
MSHASRKSSSRADCSYSDDTSATGVSSIRCFRHFYAFNTVNQISVLTEDASVLDAVEEAARRYELLFSRTDASSQLARINANAGQPVEVDPELADLISNALDYCETTEGLYDITMGTVVRLWDFKTRVIPSLADTAAALEHVDYRQVLVEGNMVQLKDSQAALDLGGIAKGYIADRMAALLRERDVNSAIINLGGNVFVLGSRPDGSPWRVGLRKPLPSNDQTQMEPFAAVEVRDCSVVTSGVYERAFDLGGRLYHHILDPRSGRPAKTDLLSATLIAPTSLQADGLTTALIIMGLDAALDFVEHKDGLEAIFVSSSTQIYATSGVGNDIPFTLHLSGIRDTLL